MIVSSPALITPRPINAFPHILAANVPNNIGRNPPLCSFVSLIPFISNPDFSSDLTIFIMSSISSFQVINAVIVPDP